MDGVRLLLTCGLPGAGKTTLAAELAESQQAVRLTKDEWQWDLGSSPWDRELGERLEGQLWALAQELLQLGVTVILDFGLRARAERDELRTEARRLGVGVELHYLHAPLDELWRRIEKRNSVPPWGAEPISRKQLAQWQTLFEAPGAEEMALFDAPDMTVQVAESGPSETHSTGGTELDRPTLALFCGAPGSGKTTLAKDLAEQGHGLRICTDDWQEALGVDHGNDTFHEHLQNRLYEHALDLLDRGQAVIFEDGLWMRTERDQKLADARHHGARAELHLFDLTFEQLWARISNRNEHGPPGAVQIDRAAFERIWDRFEQPDTTKLAQFDDYEIHGADDSEPQVTAHSRPGTFRSRR